MWYLYQRFISGGMPPSTDVWIPPWEPIMYFYFTFFIISIECVGIDIAETKKMSVCSKIKHIPYLFIRIYPILYRIINVSSCVQAPIAAVYIENLLFSFAKMIVCYGYCTGIIYKCLPASYWPDSVQQTNDKIVSNHVSSIYFFFNNNTKRNNSKPAVTVAAVYT